MQNTKKWMGFLRILDMSWLQTIGHKILSSLKRTFCSTSALLDFTICRNNDVLKKNDKSFKRTKAERGFVVSVRRTVTERVFRGNGAEERQQLCGRTTGAMQEENRPCVDPLAFCCGPFARLYVCISCITRYFSVNCECTFYLGLNFVKCHFTCRTQLRSFTNDSLYPISVHNT